MSAVPEGLFLFDNSRIVRGSRLAAESSHNGTFVFHTKRQFCCCYLHNSTYSSE